jgi:hypothetical protein
MQWRHVRLPSRWRDVLQRLELLHGLDVLHGRHVRHALAETAATARGRCLAAHGVGEL